MQPKGRKVAINYNEGQLCASWFLSVSVMSRQVESSSCRSEVEEVQRAESWELQVAAAEAAIQLAKTAIQLAK